MGDQSELKREDEAAATDLVLLAAWRDGDTSSANRLLRRYFPALYRFFRSKVDDGADELIQRTMLASTKAVEQFRGASSFRTYLFTIARNELYRFLRSRHQNVQIDPSISAIADLGETPSTVAVAQQRQKIVVLALRRLPLALQIVLELHYWEEFSSTQIAEILQIPVGTAKNRIAQAKQRMLDLLPEVVESPDVLATTTDDLEAWLRSMQGVLHPDEGAA